MSELIDIIAPEYDEASGCEPMLLFWYVNAGDAVVEGQDLCEIESAKAVVVITAPADGTLTEIVAGEGYGIESGQVLGRLQPAAAEPPPAAPQVNLTLIVAPQKCQKCEQSEALVARLQARFPGALDYHRHTTDDPEAARFGVIMPPLLAVDDLIVGLGKVPDEAKLGQLIAKRLGSEG